MSDDGKVVAVDSDGMISLSELPKKNITDLKKYAIELGIKKPGIGWPLCCPPTGNKADIIHSINYRYFNPKSDSDSDSDSDSSKSHDSVGVLDSDSSAATSWSTWGTPRTADYSSTHSFSSDDYSSDEDSGVSPEIIKIIQEHSTSLGGYAIFPQLP